MENETQEEKVEQTEINKNWLEEETKELEQTSTFDGEMQPALVLEEKKVTEVEIDFSKPFEKWTSPEGTVKKIIPVVHEGDKNVFWLNVRNPIYREIIEKGKKGQTKFKILRTGQKQNTRYNLVD